MEALTFLPVLLNICPLLPALGGKSYFQIAVIYSAFILCFSLSRIPFLITFVVEETNRNSVTQMSSVAVQLRRGYVRNPPDFLVNNAMVGLQKKTRLRAKPANKSFGQLVVAYIRLPLRMPPSDCLSRNLFLWLALPPAHLRYPSLPKSEPGE